MHWIDHHYTDSTPAISAKIRYRQNQQPCQAKQIDEDIWAIHFTEPQRAVTPGQYAVFYDGAQCLGGGVISARKA
jgi:tRNA-specific 2-thiouridylase